MKAKRSAIRRRGVTVVSALVSLLLMSGSIPAFARRLDDDSVTGPIPAAHPVSANAAGGVGSWIVLLIVVIGIVAVAAALIGTVRIYRTRARAVGVGA